MRTLVACLFLAACGAEDGGPTTNSTVVAAAYCAAYEACGGREFSYDDCVWWIDEGEVMSSADADTCVRYWEAAQYACYRVPAPNDVPSCSALVSALRPR